MRAWRLFLLGLVLLPASGCGLFDLFGEGTRQSRPFAGSTRSRLWRHVKEVVNSHWRLKEIDEHDYYLQTEWDTHLGPMYKSGLRRQVNAWVHDSAAGPYFEVQVLREINVNIKKPLSEADADWESDGRDAQQEKRVLYEVEVSLEPPKATQGVGEPSEKDRWTGGIGEDGSRRDLWERRGR